MEDELDHNKTVPKGLRIVGVLTLINLGFAGFSSFLGMFSRPLSPEQMENYLALNVQQIKLMQEQGFGGMADSMQKVIHVLEYTNENHYLHHLLNLMVCACGIIGVVMMWKGKRWGFHAYIISSLLKLASFYLFIPIAEVPGILLTYYAFTTLIFVLLYRRFMDHFDDLTFTWK